MRRVMITGLGAVTPLGNSVQDFWTNLCAGASAIDYIRRFDASHLQSRIAAEIRNLPPIEDISEKQVRRMGRFALLAVLAAQQAWKDAQLQSAHLDPYQVGVTIGSTHGGEDAMLAEIDHIMDSNSRAVSPWLIPRMLLNMASAQVAIHLSLHGPSFAIVSACATGAHSIGEAAEVIRRGDALVMVCGGTESCITPLTLIGDQATLSKRNEEPKRASRPFDSERDGFVLGEGACILVLEERDHALNRGIPFYAEVSGYSTTTDALHVAAPEPTGVHLAKAIEQSLKKASILPEQLSAIFTHSTGTKSGDQAEARALQKALGNTVVTTPLTAIKSTLGHLFAASGAIQALAATKALQQQLLPPTINLEHPEPEYASFNFVRDHALSIPLTHILSISAGFGGHNVALVLSREKTQERAYEQ